MQTFHTRFTLLLQYYYIIIYLKLNLRLYHPKKDRCDVCCGHEAGNITDAEIAQHRKRKEKARKEKETDKDLAKEGKCHVFTQDVQSVK